MAQIVRTEKRKRGVVGWVFKLAFIAYNVIMLMWIISAWVGVSQIQSGTDAEKTGTAIGALIGTSFILFIWAAGVIILGLLTLMTRGKKVTIEITTG